jgi:hypothetical protein
MKRVIAEQHKQNIIPVGVKLDHCWNQEICCQTTTLSSTMERSTNTTTTSNYFGFDAGHVHANKIYS